MCHADFIACGAEGDKAVKFSGGAFHDNADAGVSEHFHIVFAVSERNRMLSLDAELIAQQSDARCLVKFL